MVRLLYAILLVALTAANYAWDFETNAWQRTGITPLGTHFADMYSRLARVDAFRQGKETYDDPSYDLYGRVDTYPPSWAIFKYTGLRRPDVVPVSLFFIGLFFIIAAWVMQVQRPVELLVALVFLNSPSAFLAVERANSDLIILSLTALFAWLLAQRSPRLSLGSGLVLYFSAALKVYPFFLIVPWLMQVRQAGLRFIFLGFGVALLALYYALFAWENARFLQQYPHPLVIGSFGLEILLANAAILNNTASVFIALIVCMLLILMAQPFRALSHASVSLLPQIMLGCGISILCGCFIAGTHYPYRLISAIFLLPASFELLRNRNAGWRLHMVVALAMALLLLPMFLSLNNILAIRAALSLKVVSAQWLCLLSQAAFILAMYIYIHILWLLYRPAAGS